MCSLIPMSDFVSSLRKQFIFQKGKFGKRSNLYYTALNRERGLKNDSWAMIVFIHVAPQYGFTHEEIREELKIRSSLYEILRNEIPTLINKNCSDQKLHKTIIVKSGLVKNNIFSTFLVKPIKVLV